MRDRPGRCLFRGPSSPSALPSGMPSPLPQRPRDPCLWQDSKRSRSTACIRSRACSDCLSFPAAASTLCPLRTGDRPHLKMCIRDRSKGLTCLFQQRLQRRYLTFYLVKLYHCLTSFSVLYGAAAVAADYGCIVPCKCAEKIRCPCDIHVRAASRSLRSRASLAKILLAARHLAEQNVLTGDTPAALSRFQRATRGESSLRRWSPRAEAL